MRNGGSILAGVSPPESHPLWVPLRNLFWIPLYADARIPDPPVIRCIPLYGDTRIPDPALRQKPQRFWHLTTVWGTMDPSEDIYLCLCENLGRANLPAAPQFFCPLAVSPESEPRSRKAVMT